MPIPDDYEAESLYAPEAWFVHDLLEVDQEGRRVLGLLDTTRIGALVQAQRTVAGHEPHVPAAVAVQMTGTLAGLHAVYVLGMRSTEGWFGYGTHIHWAKFPSMGHIGPPVHAECLALSVRDIRRTRFIKYAYRFVQDDREIYVSEQTAAWLKGAPSGA